MNRPSFEEYVLSRENNANLFEMPVPPTAFKNDAGNFGDDVHVSSNAPIFMDREDILYLYQFPRKYWTDAMYARYNRYLPKAKTEPNFNDIQDIVLTGHRGVRLVFHNRNTFAKHLVDKIERTVDVDHFRQSNKTGDDYKRHQTELAGHRASGKDMGGYIGATLADPRRHPEHEDLLVFKGMVAPNKEVLGASLNKWMQGSSEGWLSDLSKSDHQRVKVKAAGGRGGGSELATFTGKSLAAIHDQMKQAGAVPFEIGKDHQCLWRDVTVEGKKGTKRMTYFGGDIENPLQGSPLPVLSPGKEIHSKDMQAHENDKKFLEKLRNMKGTDLQQIRSDLTPEIKKLEDEVQRRDLSGWETEDPDDSEERSEVLSKIENLKNLNNYRTWFKEKYPNSAITPETIEQSLSKYQDVIQEKMRARQANSRKYDAYDWNVHRFNRDRHPYDPLNVGMGNPTKAGQRKFEAIARGKTTGFGTLWPNRQSPTLIHGEKGEWEDKFKSHFGHGYDPRSNSFNLKSSLDSADAHEIEREAKIYFAKIAEKLIHQDEVIQALKLTNDSEKNDAKLAFTTAATFRDFLKKHFPSLKLDKSSNMSDDSMPQILKIAYTEIKTTENTLSRIREEASTGVTNTSAIANGVDKFLKSQYLAQYSDLQTALMTQRTQLIMNAEHLVRRTIGDSPFKTFADHKAKGIRGSKKLQSIQDLQQFIANIANNYVARISQLNFDELGTRRERNKNGPGKVSMDTSGSEETGSMAGNIAASDGRPSADQWKGAPDGRHIAKAKYNVVPDDVRNKYRQTRQSSDIDTHQIGHNIDSVYATMAAKASEIAANVIQNLNRDALPEEPSMFKNIANGVLLHRYFFQRYMAATKNQGASKKEADKYAKQAVDKYSKMFKGGSGNSDPQDMSSFAQNFKSRVDDDADLDMDEKEAASIISKWEDSGLNPNDLNLKLNNMTVAARHSRQEKDKRIADLILMYHGRKPELGSFEVGTNVAASATGALPDIELNAAENERIRQKLLRMKQILHKAPATQPIHYRQPLVRQMQSDPVPPAAPKPASTMSQYMANRPKP
jgi:hypothetical protein